MTRPTRPRERGASYTPAEDTIIRQHYPTEGAVGCAKRLNRTPKSVGNRAQYLGVKFTPPKPRKRNDRGITFSKNDHAPMSIQDLGKPREYPRVKPLGEPCPTHPSNTIGAFGCPACNAGQRWATRQRQTVMRPHHEGGR